MMLKSYVWRAALHGCEAWTVGNEDIRRTSPTRAAFKIAWTELFHLPRNSDGSLTSSRLTEGGRPPDESGAPLIEGGEDPDGESACGFQCPGPARLCIPAHLVCNGVVNCPNITSTSDGEDLSDESSSLCRRGEMIAGMNWYYVAGLGVFVVIVLCCACACVYRRCCRRC